MNKHSYIPPCKKIVLQELYYSKKQTYSEIACLLGVSVKRIQTAMKFYRLTPRKAVKRDQSGENNSNWKGDSAGYAALHRRLYNDQPSKCDVCGTTDPSKTYDWANMTGKYTDPKDYKRMCRSCHWKHDGTIKNIAG